MQTPTLMVAGIHDKQVDPDRVRELYADLGSAQKVMIDLGCSSHNAMWEKRAHAALPRLARVAREGHRERLADGVMRMGY